MLKKIVIAFLLLFIQAAHADTAMPRALKRAFAIVHKSAAQSSVKNLFMFNYVYYSSNLCKDQDCSVANVQKQIEIAKLKMGDDFEKYLIHYDKYKVAIQSLQGNLPKGDLASLSGLRTASQVLKTRTFTTCIDYTKAFLAKAIEFGFPAANLKFYVLMSSDGYSKMCPGGENGLRPVTARPLVHTLVAYRVNNNWYTLNVEDPEAIPSFVGTALPSRLARSYQFTYPALVAYQPLKLAGSFEPKDFIDGFDFGGLLGITAGGKLESDPDKIICE